MRTKFIEVCKFIFVSAFYCYACSNQPTSSLCIQFWLLFALATQKCVYCMLYALCKPQNTSFAFIFRNFSASEFLFCPNIYGIVFIQQRGLHREDIDFANTPTGFFGQYGDFSFSVVISSLSDAAADPFDPVSRRRPTGGSSEWRSRKCVGRAKESIVLRQRVFWYFRRLGGPGGSQYNRVLVHRTRIRKVIISQSVFY